MEASASRVEAPATSNGDGRFVGIEKPAGTKTTARWNLKYGQLKEYRRRHGDCLVSTLDEANNKLGTWVMTQRREYHLFRKGKKSAMTEEKILRLEEIGFLWDASHMRGKDRNKGGRGRGKVGGVKLTAKWDQRYKELIEYKNEHGHCNVPLKFELNQQLGRWVFNQRYQYRVLQQGKKSLMTMERIAQLNEIGFLWDARYLKGGNSENWDQRYKELIDYKQKHGDCNVSQQYKANKPLGIWVQTQRTQYRRFQLKNKSPMTEERIHKLEKIGFEWKVRG